MNQLYTLTEIESMGLESECNMADGHAYNDLSLEQMQIVSNLPRLWHQALSKKHKQAEEDFKLRFAELARCPSLTNYRHFRVCPTASNSIDTMGTWLKEKGLKTLLIEPTFDNLALILKRRGVEVASIDEDSLMQLAQKSPTIQFDALFLVNPNNPTGRTLLETEFVQIVQWCAQHGKVLLLDNTFRFFAPQLYDTYQIMLDAGVSFVSIEDTGKVWPTQDLKVSLIFFSADIAAEMNFIYEEIYLCISSFQLEVLGAFLKDAHVRGLDRVVWQEVARRRAAFRQVITGSMLEIHPSSLNSKISVEWVHIKDQGINDFDLTHYFKDFGLIVLPGRHFYWDSHGPSKPLNSLRISLLKPKKQFEESLAVMQHALMQNERNSAFLCAQA